MSYWHGLIYRPDCHLCPLQNEKKVFPDGNIPAKLVIVGEEPGHLEVERGRGFIGQSGQLLWQLARYAGLPERDMGAIFVTNASLCKAPSDLMLSTGAMLKKGKIKSLAVQACRRRLLWEIMYVTQSNPGAVVVPLGNWAYWALTGAPDPRITQYRGSVQWFDLRHVFYHTGAPSDALIARASAEGRYSKR